MAREQTAKTKLLETAFALIRERGFSAMTVDDLCTRAGVTKGAFFHHFANKEELGVAAANHWSLVTGSLFARAPYHERETALERVLAYVDLRRSLLQGEIASYTCVAGTMVQEVYEKHPEIRDACGACIFDHAATLVEDIRTAMADHGVVGSFSAESLAAYTQAVLQGAFVLAKARDDVVVAQESVEHLRRYIELIFSSRAAAFEAAYAG